MIANYNFGTDPVIQALIAEAKADPDVIGLLLLGSRAIGGVTSESDYDAIFVVTNKAATHYEQTKMAPVRGTTIIPPIKTFDVWHDCPSGMQLGKIDDWMLPAFAECAILYDRTGETAHLVEGLGRMPADQAHGAVAKWYDTYLNGLYRSLKAWRRGNTLGARMEAAQTADYLLNVLFALERRWRPYSSRLIFHLANLAHQGWQPDELQGILLDLISTGNPKRQQAVAQQVVLLLQKRGYGHIYDEWGGEIDEVLAWDFPETA